MTWKNFIWNWIAPTLVAVCILVASERAISNPSGLTVSGAFCAGALLMLGLRRALVSAVNRYTLAALRSLVSAMEHGEDSDIRSAHCYAAKCVADIDGSLSAEHNQEGWFRKRWPFKRSVAAVVEAPALGDRK